MKIVETDNYGGDYPDEKFLNIPNISSDVKANQIVELINESVGAEYPRIWKVVEDNYTLVPGFQP